MVEENKKVTKEELKRQAKVRRGLLKAVALTVGLNGAVAGHAEAKTVSEPEPQGIEVTYEPQSNVRSSEKTVTLEQAAAIARASSKGEANVSENRAPDDVSYRTQQEYMTADEYAEAHGLVYSARLSRGLDRYGDGKSFFGYAGAYINPYSEGHSDQVIFLPNDLFYNRNLIRSTSLGYAQAQQSEKTDMYFPNKYVRYNDRDVRGTTKTERNIRKAVRIADDVLRIIDVVGGHRR